MEMHPLKRVVLTLRVPAPSTAHAALSGALTWVCGVVSGLDTGSCVLPVFKEQTQAWILHPLPCPWCLSGPAPCSVPEDVAVLGIC